MTKKTVAQLTKEINTARAAGDWDLASKLNDDRRRAEVDADEAALTPKFKIVATDKLTGIRVYGRRTITCELSFREGLAVNRQPGDTTGLHTYPHRGTEMGLAEAGELLVRINANHDEERSWVRDICLVQA